MAAGADDEAADCGAGVWAEGAGAAEVGGAFCAGCGGVDSGFLRLNSPMEIRGGVGEALRWLTQAAAGRAQ